MKWYIKASIQKLLSLCPLNEHIYFPLQKTFGGHRRLNIANRVKQMNNIFDIILSTYGSISGLKITEIGTGWIPIVPVSLALTGMQCQSFDVKRLIKKEMIDKTLNDMNDQLEILSEMSKCPIAIIKKNYELAVREVGVDGILENLSIRYIAPIDTSNLPVVNDSQDVIITRAVLQHIPPDKLPAVIHESYRILKPEGISIHIVSLHDEYVDVDADITKINFLKYSEWFWENFGNNAFKYINRARYPYYLNLFQNSGFKVLKFLRRIDERSFAEVRQSMKIAKSFRHHTPEELATVGFTAILKKV